MPLCPAFWALSTLTPDSPPSPERPETGGQQPGAGQGGQEPPRPLPPRPRVVGEEGGALAATSRAAFRRDE